MKDKSRIIFGNVMSPKDYKAALKSKEKYIRKFGDDSLASHPAKLTENKYIGDILGVRDIRISEGSGDIPFDTEKGIIVGNIRMGFGHYRISMPWPPPPMRWDTPPTGWISIPSRRPPARR